MQLISQPTDYSALLCAFAMVLNKSYDEMVRIVGHDGGSVSFPREDFPFNLQLFTVEQLTQICVDLGYKPVSLKYLICREESGVPAFVEGRTWGKKHFLEFLKGKPGILILQEQKISRLYHAVAWDGNMIYDSFDKKIRELNTEIDIIVEFIWVE